MAGGMEAKDDFGAGRFFEAQPLGADGDTTIVADFEERAHAPDIVPPRTFGRGAQDGAFFFFGIIPGAQWSLAQFAMDFMGVAMGAQGVDVLVGFVELGDFFTGKIGRQATLPELVFAFDFAFGLGGGRVAQADVVELERPTQLGQRVRIVCEKEAVVIDVKLERTSMGEKGGGQKIEIGKKEFAFVNPGAGEKTAAIIEQVEHGKGDFGMGEPAVGRGIELPEFADLGALPAANRSEKAFGRDGVSEFIFDGPVPDLSAVELEGMEAQGFGGDKAIRRRRHAVESFAEQFQHGLRPGCGVVSSGSAGNPERVFFIGAGAEVGGEQNVKAAGRQAEFLGSVRGADSMIAERVEHMPDKGRSMAVDELLMFFKLAEYQRNSPRRPSFRRASLRSPSSKTDGAERRTSCFANYRTCPVLIAPRHGISKCLKTAA